MQAMLRKGTQMDDRIVVITITITLSIGTLTVHLIFATRIWQHHSFPGTLWRLAGLSVLTFVGSRIIAAPLEFYTAMDLLNPSPKAKLAYDVFWHTLGLDFLDFCGFWPRVGAVLGGPLCFIVGGLLAPFLFFFLLASLPALFVHRKSGKLGMRAN
jgi:hypothetical protein